MTQPAEQPDVTIDDLARAELQADATRWEKRMKALTLRNAGTPWPAVAATFGITEETAKRWVRDATKEVIRLPVDQMVDRQRAILLDITRRNYTAAMSDGEDAREAQNMIVKCLEHEAKLFGLYAPARVAIGISENEFGTQAAELLKAVGAAPLAEIAGLSRSEMAALLPHPETDPGGEPGSDVVDAEVIDEGDGWSNL